MLSNADAIPQQPVLVCANSQRKWKRSILVTASKTSWMVAGQFLNKIVNKLSKSVQNWKSYFEYAIPHSCSISLSSKSVTQFIVSQNNLEHCRHCAARVLTWTFYFIKKEPMLLFMK